MKHVFIVIMAIALCSLYESDAQNCNCTLSQVLNNTVAPCTLTTGPVVTVGTESALISAINQANTSGGNMTILIENGTYQIASVSWYPYITASNVIFRSVSGERDSVIIRGGGMANVSPGSESGFLIAGDHVLIADMTIREVGNHGIQVSGHHLFVHNVRIQNTYQQMIKGATAGSSIDSAVVQCCLLEYPAGTGPQYYIGGLDIHKGRGWRVSDNVIRNVKSPSASAAEHGVHFWDNSMGNIVERNMIVNCDRGIGFGLGSSPNEGGIIRNNMVFNDGSGQYDDVGIGLETSPNTRVYNNTVFIDYPNAIEYRFTATVNAEIMNNLTNKLITSRDGATAALSANFTGAQAGWFVNAAAGDLHLDAAQPSAVDQGANLILFVSDDIDRTSRPQGAAFDIGAHEFSQQVAINEHDETAFPVVFPNPCRGKFCVKAVKSETSLELVNLLGEVVMSVNLQPGINIIDVDAGIRGLFLYVLKTGVAVSGNGVLIME